MRCGAAESLPRAASRAGGGRAASTRVVRNHLAYTAPIVIDARMKPWYPKEVTCDPATAATVTYRWQEYFPSANVAMGDSERGHLD